VSTGLASEEPVGPDDGPATGGDQTSATQYDRADKAEKGRILDELCGTTGWHRKHARRALTEALTPKIVRPRAPQPPWYGPEVAAALAFPGRCRVTRWV